MRIFRVLVFVLGIFGACLGTTQASEPMFVERGADIVGTLRTFRVTGDETLLEVARVYDLGFNEMNSANPEVDPWVPGEGNTVLIPTQWLLPDSARKGIVINLAEMRLYQFQNIDGKRFVRTYPIGVGVEGFETPTGTYRTGVKIVDPVWYVPKSIRRAEPDRPVKVPPGEDNPLGKYAIKLQGTRLFIHGTSEPYGIGRKVSHGCIRLYPEDIEAVFPKIEKGTLVNIVYQPIKVGHWKGRLFIEVHPDYLGREGDLMSRAISILKRRRLLDKVDKELLRTALKEQLGIPVALSGKADKDEELILLTNAPDPHAEDQGHSR